MTLGSQDESKVTKVSWSVCRFLRVCTRKCIAFIFTMKYRRLMLSDWGPLCIQSTGHDDWSSSVLWMRTWCEFITCQNCLDTHSSFPCRWQQESNRAAAKKAANFQKEIVEWYFYTFRCIGDWSGSNVKDCTKDSNVNGSVDLESPFTLLQKLSKCEVKAWLCCNLIILPVLRFYVKSNFGEF